MKQFLNKNIIIPVLIVIIMLVVVFIVLPIISNDPMPIADENVDISDELQDDTSITDDSDSLQNTGEEVFSVESYDVYSFTITDNSGVEAAFDRDENIFVYREDTSALLDQEQIDTCLSYLCNIYADSTADGIELKQPHSFSVEDASGNTTIIDIYDGPDKLCYFTLNNDATNIYINNGTLNYLLDLNVSDLF